MRGTVGSFLSLSALMIQRSSFPRCALSFWRISLSHFFLILFLRKSFALCESTFCVFLLWGGEEVGVVCAR